MALKLGCFLERIPVLKVSATNGDELTCNEVCRKFTWWMQGQSIVADVLTLPLENYDVVLGIQWLVELGDIKWNFKDLQMRFMIGGNECVLKGSKGISKTVVTISSDKMDRVLEKKAQLSILQCYELQLICQGSEDKEIDSTGGGKIVKADIEEILKEFQDVFKEPDKLPPCRTHDHSITLVEGVKPINIRPYRYGALQKDVIEKMTHEMLKSGVIQNSVSCFSSLVVLVKKKMDYGECVLTTGLGIDRQ